MEEREDYLVQAPPPASSNRRRSAPSPRLQPGVLPTRHDFQAWAMANGVPHAPGGTGVPIYSHHLQPNPLSSSNIYEGGNSALTNPLVQQQQLRNGNASVEAFARYQQASQALSQANLQQQQQQVQAAQDHQQQLMATLPALLAATTLRGHKPPRRFNDNTYRYYRQQHHPIHQNQYQQVQQSNLASPSISVSNHLLYPHSGNVLSNSATGYNGQSATLERRSSWDGAQTTTVLRQRYVGSSSMSEAGAGELGGATGVATAPTSPILNGGNLSLFTQQAVPSTTSSMSTASSPTTSTYNTHIVNGDPRLPRDKRVQGTGHERSPIAGPRGRLLRQRDDQVVRGTFSQYQPSSTVSRQSLPITVSSGRAAKQQGSVPNSAAATSFQQTSQLMSSPGGSYVKFGSRDDKPGLSQHINGEDEENFLVAGTIRFGNFDAAFYSSEPAEMAGLGLFNGIPGAESPFQSSLPSNLEPSVSMPDELPPSPRLSFKSPGAPPAATPDPALSFQHGMINKSASVAKSSLSRPPMHNRRKSAGDEVELSLKDVTFFGNVPVDKDERVRKQAMAALLKESGKDFGKPESPPIHIKARRTSASSSNTNDSSSLLQLRTVLPSLTSSSASVTSTSTSASPSELFAPATPPSQF